MVIYESEKLRIHVFEKNGRYYRQSTQTYNNGITTANTPVRISKKEYEKEIAERGNNGRQ